MTPEQLDRLIADLEREADHMHEAADRARSVGFDIVAARQRAERNGIAYAISRLVELRGSGS